MSGKAKAIEKTRELDLVATAMRSTAPTPSSCLQPLRSPPDLFRASFQSFSWC